MMSAERRRTRSQTSKQKQEEEEARATITYTTDTTITINNGRSDKFQMHNDEGITRQRRNIYPIASIDSFCLVVSSTFFLIPGIFAFSRSFYLFGVVSVVTTAVSVNYWRNAVEGYRRTADLITAKTSFAIYFTSGCMYIRDPMLLAIGIPGCICIIFCYVMSSRYWALDLPHWKWFHMMFHLFVALEQFLVLYGIIIALQ